MNSIPVNKSNSKLTMTGVSPYETFADNTAGPDAQLIKFTKGVWSTGQSKETIALEARFVAIVTGLRHGFVKWLDGNPVERRMTLVADRPIPPGRNELGELNEGDWPIGRDGTRSDPWQFTFELPMADLQTEGARLYTTTTYGGRQTVSRLARTYGQHDRKHPGYLPVIELKCESYEHERYGPQQNPVLKIVDWILDPDWSPPEPSAAPASLSGELDDEIPFG